MHRASGRSWRAAARILLLTGLLAAGLASAQQKEAATPLDAYLKDLKTLRVEFLQTLTDSHDKETDRASGVLIVSRPGKFSWEIHPQNAAGGNSGAGQLMLCDGTNLWFLDRDLQQVTVKPVDATLTATPAMLLSGGVDLRGNFKITPAGERGGLSWVLVEPNGADADFRSARFGFLNGDLKRMILDDKLGQTATLVFQKVVRNGPVSPDEVTFTAPPNVDVIGTPRK